MSLEFIDKYGGRRIVRSVAMRRSAADLYQVWRDLSAWPRFMHNVARISEEGAKSYWDVRVGSDIVRWVVELTAAVPGRVIAWRTLIGPGAPQSGEILLQRTPNPRVTEVRVTLEYDPPKAPATWTQHHAGETSPARQLDETLDRLKEQVESAVRASNRAVTRGAFL